MIVRLFCDCAPGFTCAHCADPLPDVMRDEDLRPFGYRDTWPSSGAQAPVLVLVCEEVTEELRLF